jgi:hypothetical protein
VGDMGVACTCQPFLEPCKSRAAVQAAVLSPCLVSLPRDPARRGPGRGGDGAAVDGVGTAYQNFAPQ